MTAETRIFRPQLEWVKAGTRFDFHPVCEENDLVRFPERVADMKEDGYDASYPIVLLNHLIIDGRGRYLDALEANVDFLVKHASPNSDPEKINERANNLRRHDTPERLAAKKAKRIQKVVASRDEGKSIRQIAEEQGVSKSQVERDLSTVPEGTVETNGRAAPAQIVGRDGKKRDAKILCDRCKRIGSPVKDCPACKEARQRNKPKETKKVDKPEKGDAHEPPTLDRAGHKIPESAMPAFANVEKFEELDSLCRKLQAGIDELARLKGGEQLARFTNATQSGEKTIHKNEHLQRLKGDLRGTRPYSVCPYCAGKAPKTCKGCTGTGWVTKTTWDAADDAIKGKLACTN